MIDGSKVEVILCSVAWRQRNSDGNWFGGLVPIYESTEDRWVPIDDAAKRFPDVGQIFWWDAPSSACEGSLWLIEYAEAHGYDPPLKKDRFQVSRVSNAQRLIEAVFVSEVLSNQDLRTAISGGLVGLAPAPIAPVIIKVPESENCWLGPVKPEHSANQQQRQSFIIPASSGFLPQIELSDEALQDIQVGGAQHTILRPWSKLPAPNFFFCVQGNRELLLSLLRRIRHFSVDAAEALGVTRTVLENYIEVLDRSRISGDNALRESARLEAAKGLLDQIEGDGQLVQTAIDSLMATQTIDSRVRETIAEKVQEAVEKIEAEAQVATEETTSKLEALKAKMKQLREKTEAEEAILQASKEEVKKAVNDLITDAVTQIVGQTTVQRVLASLDNPTEKGTFGPTTALPQAEVPNRLHEDKEQLLTTLLSCSIQAKVDLNVPAPCLAALVGAGAIIVDGNGADDIVSVLSQTLAGKMTARVSVSVTTFGIQELLSSPCSIADRGDGMAMCLGDFLRSTEESKLVTLLILEEVNRAPPESFLPDLLRASRSGSAGRQLCWLDQSGVPVSTDVAGRIFLICIPTHGQSAFKFSSRLAEKIPFMLTSRSVRTIVPAEMDAATDMSCNISPEDLTRLLDADNCNDRSLQTAESLANVAFVGGDKEAFVRYARYFSSLIDDPDTAVAEAFVSLTAATGVNLAQFADEDGNAQGAIEKIKSLLDEPQIQSFKSLMDLGDRRNV